MMSKLFKFSIHCPSEISAGLRGFEDTVTVNVESGNLGNEESTRDFEYDLKEFLAEWFNEAHITHINVEQIDAVEQHLADSMAEYQQVKRTMQKMNSYIDELHKTLS